MSGQTVRPARLAEPIGRTAGGAVSRANGAGDTNAAETPAPAREAGFARCEGGPRAAAPARDSARRWAPGQPVYAALDLGTNNCRLLVAVPEDGGFKVIDAFSRIVRLGEGLGMSGRLGEAAQSRAIEALKVCRDKMRARRVTRARLIATEACRAASNAQDFLDRVRREVGIELEIVDRGTEARLAVSGCSTLIAPEAKGVVLFDIGGGSSELVWLDLIRHKPGRVITRSIRAWTSLPLGVVTLAERFGGVDVDRRIFEAMVRDVLDDIDAFPAGERIAERMRAGDTHLLGTSGTVTTLAGLHLGLKRYDRRKVDGLWMRSEEVEGLIDQLLDMPYESRVASPCIGPDRADLVLAGCAILEAIRRRWPSTRLRVADRGLREGILATLMAEDAVAEPARKPKKKRRGRRRGGRKRAAAQAPSPTQG